MRIRLAIRAALPSVLALAAGCNSIEARNWNLGQVHDHDGEFKRVGALMSAWEYSVYAGISMVTGRRTKMRTPGVEVIDDPLGISVANLVHLSNFDPDDPRNAALQIEWFAFLAVQSPWKLDRERCVIELGRHGRRLGVSAPSAPPPEGEAAGVDEVVELVRRLMDAVEGLARSDASDPEPAAELEAACAAAREPSYDRAGALRVLRATTSLGRASVSSSRLEPLDRLNAHLQRICVERALAESLLDPEPLVRAAALRACVQTFGEGVLAEFLMMLCRSRVAFAETMLLSVFDLVAERGLPAVPETLGGRPFPEAQRERERLVWIDRLVQAAVHHPSGTVRISAMKALATATGAPSSLREDEWQLWWSEEGPRMEGALPGAGGGAPAGGGGAP